MKFFAIRHKPTGKFMPQRQTKSGGWSWWSPADPNDAPYDPPPRLFVRKLNASNALSQWLVGPQKIGRSTGYYDEPDVPEPIKVEGMSPRAKDEMEIVSVWLSIGGAMREAAPTTINRGGVSKPEEGTTVPDSVATASTVNGDGAGVASGAAETETTGTPDAAVACTSQ